MYLFSSKDTPRFLAETTKTQAIAGAAAGAAFGVIRGAFRCATIGFKILRPDGDVVATGPDVLAGRLWAGAGCVRRSGWVWLLGCSMAMAGQAAAAPCVSGPISAAVLQQVEVERRIHSAPPAVTALALRRNLGNGVAVRPRPAELDHPVVPALRRMLRGLPGLLGGLVRDHVAAIYLVRGNFGSARVEAARDDGGWLVGGCILLNLDALERTANDWASWRESSAFRADDAYRIRIRLEPPETDDVEHAVRFVFVHELGHILGMVAGVHGFWAAPETWPLTAQSSYTRLSWRADGKKLAAPGKQRFPVLALPRFYRFEAAPLPRSVAPIIYRALAGTNWPSLYGSIDPYEDFAETFALYIHTRLFGSPFEVDLYRGGKHIGGYRSCLDTGRCPQKLEYIERLLRRVNGR